MGRGNKHGFDFGSDKRDATGFMNKVRKKSLKVPGVGAYNITKGDKVVTLGLSKGWK